MTTEQRRALANMIPTTEVIKDAVTYPRERLGEPLDISAERFDAWLARVRRDAARSALTEYARYAVEHAWRYSTPPDPSYFRDREYPEETP